MCSVVCRRVSAAAGAGGGWSAARGPTHSGSSRMS